MMGLFASVENIWDDTVVVAQHRERKRTRFRICQLSQLVFLFGAEVVA